MSTHDRAKISNAVEPTLDELAARTNNKFVSDETLARLAKVSSGTLTTQLFKRGYRQPVMVGITALNKATKPFAGRAYTMRFIPAREDLDTVATVTTGPNPDNLQWFGVEQVAEGDVLVIDSRGDSRAAAMGDVLIKRMMLRGARAVITDGAYRDGDEIAEMEIPAWCAGVTATSRLSFHHVADLQVPIGCAGVAVFPGDIIHGDRNNITVIPAHLADELADVCEAQDDIENYIAQRIGSGDPIWGVFPADEKTRQAYQQWVADGRPALPQK
ncbi:ribonuclease activity regulator RraA [Pantoea sp. Ap-967]|uniref:RraA family protein n=1 Tax=Pantoea sp. Ap-967 TaxID=2608362 RepID=UPI00141E7773|nr:ribonuclease activity regulator RraA [Pantoea sp. Ap-967]NIE73295.1 ribonuclease activity regulator RraA [Pantoea sp. Ap-967]